MVGSKSKWTFNYEAFWFPLGSHSIYCINEQYSVLRRTIVHLLWINEFEKVDNKP